MLKIGITGGVGSGKTSISRYFETLGIPVYNTDQKTRFIVNNDLRVKSNIIKLLGEESYVNNSYNNVYVAEKVFKDKTLLNELQIILTNPLTNDIERWCKNNSSAPYVLIESAIFYETNSESLVDFMIGIDAPIVVRIERVMKRDNVTIQAVKERILHQTHDANIEKCDFVIENIDKPYVLEAMKIHNILLKISALCCN